MASSQRVDLRVLLSRLILSASTSRRDDYTGFSTAAAHSFRALMTLFIYFLYSSRPDVSFCTQSLPFCAFSLERYHGRRHAEETTSSFLGNAVADAEMGCQVARVNYHQLSSIADRQLVEGRVSQLQPAIDNDY